jgi:hypothetical protein
MLKESCIIEDIQHPRRSCSEWIYIYIQEAVITRLLLELNDFPWEYYDGKYIAKYDI